MQTPRELARTAERFDEEQWFEFLDEIDAVSRLRQQRNPGAPPPLAAGRNDMALWIARKHIVADSSIQKVLYLPKGSPANEIRLLEVNDRLALSEDEKGRIEPIDFGLNVAGDSLQLLVADITSEQLEAILDKRLELPEGWDLADHITTDRRS